MSSKWDRDRPPLKKIKKPEKKYSVCIPVANIPTAKEVKKRIDALGYTTFIFEDEY